MDAAVWGFVGVVVGGLITVGAEFVRARNDASLDSAKRADDRRIGRDVIQRDNLLALQEKFSAWARAEGLAMEFERDALVTTGEHQALPRELHLEIFDANMELIFFVERLADDHLRQTLDRAMQRLGRGGPRPSDVTGIDARLEDFTAVYADAQLEIGRVLREYL